MTEATYTHGHHESVTRAHAARTVQNSASYLVSRLEPGQRILDVGCGPGSITIDLARRVGPAGHVTGIDQSEEVIAQARELAAESGVDNITFAVGDAYAVESPVHAFDIVHAHQVLQHLADPVAAIAEWRRAGRLVAARDVIYSATTIHPPSHGLTAWRRLVVELMAANGGEADAGSHLKAWARAAGSEQVETDVETWCFESDAARAWWGGQWVERATQSSFASGTEDLGLATAADREAIAAAWQAWSADPDGWMVMIHGWILAT